MHIGKGEQDAIRQHIRVLGRAGKAELAGVIKGMDFGVVPRDVVT